MIGTFNTILDIGFAIVVSQSVANVVNAFEAVLKR